MIPTQIAVTYTSAEKKLEAEQLADQLHIAFIADPSSELSSHYDYLLLVTPDYLGLKDKHHPKPFYIDFLSGKLRYRANLAGLRKESLAKAIGLSPRDDPVIVDATAGLGRDSFILATLGFHVILLERSLIVYTLLKDALTRAQQHSLLVPVINRMNLIHADALTWLSATHLHPDVIYLDPMFPKRKKSASVKKEMVILQDLLGNDEDSATLFNLALACTKQRVVVKRPRLAATITDNTPNYSIVGKNSRFDVYLVQKR